MKRFFIILLSIILAFSIVGCGSEKAQETKTSGKNDKKVEKVSEEEIEHLYTEPDKFKGMEVELYAKIFVPVERDDSATYIQAFADPVNSDKSTIIVIDDSTIDVKEDDIIHVIGTVEGKFKGENLVGGSIVAPTIIAKSIEKTDYATAFAPAIKTVKDIPEQEQHGCKLKIDKIEFAEKETRVYVSLYNETNDKIDFYGFNTIIVQGDKQYEVEDNFEADYPEPQSEVSPGVSTEGILAFPPIDTEAKKAKIIAEVYSDNFDIQFEPFTFEVSWE